MKIPSLNRASAVLLAALTLGAQLPVSAAGPAKSFTGVITDSMCLNDHAKMKISPEDKCVRECVRSNPMKIKYVLYDGKNVYKLSDQQLPEKYAAQKVVVTGTLFAQTGILKVDAIKLAK